MNNVRSKRRSQGQISDEGDQDDIGKRGLAGALQRAGSINGKGQVASCRLPATFLSPGFAVALCPLFLVHLSLPFL